VYQQPVASQPVQIFDQPVAPQEPVVQETPKAQVQEQVTTESTIRRSFFDRYVDKIKDFLDNAE
jgi:cell division protein FtsA